MNDAQNLHTGDESREERGDSLRIPCPGRCSITCETGEKPISAILGGAHLPDEDVFAKYRDGNPWCCLPRQHWDEENIFPWNIIERRFQNVGNSRS